MMRHIAMIAVLIATASASAQESKPLQPRKAVQKALQQSESKGGLVLKGRLEKTRPTEAEMGGVVLDVSSGPEVQGDFTARRGKDGILAVTFSSSKLTYELLCRGGKKVHRMSWTQGGAPMVAEIGYDLPRILRLDLLAKHLGPEKDAKELTDSTVDGAKCRVITCAISKALLPKPERGSGEEKEDPWDWEVHSITAIFHIGRDDGLIRRLDVRVNRQLEIDPNQEPLDNVNRYLVTVQKYDPELQVTIPPELTKLLD